MTLTNTRRSLLLASLPLSLLFAAPLLAATSLFSEVLVIEGDQMVGTAIESASTDSSAPVSVSGSSSHDVSSIGGSGDLTFSGSGFAQTNYSFLRTSAQGTVNNTYFDPDYDFDNGTGTVPTAYAVQSVSRFQDTLQYGGTAVGYNSKYVIRVTGNISDYDAFATVQLTHGMAQPQYWFFNEPGPIDVTLVSDAFVGAANQLFTLELLTGFNADTEFLGDGGFSSAAASFGNTVELLGIEARDDNGVLLPTSDFTSESGTTYSIIDAVPEPASVALAMLGAALAAGRRRP